MKIFIAIENLIQYAINKNLIEKEDIIFTKNKIIETLKIEDLKEVEPTEEQDLEKILKVLDEKKAKITFAVTGRWAEENPELLLEIQKKGHEIANHGYKHLDYGTLDYDKNYEQIKTSKEIIENITKTETKFFQAPGGSFNKETVKACNDLGYIPYKWDIDTIDWKNRQEPEVIIQRVKSKEMKDSSIILMHPTYASAEGIDDIIKIIEEKELKPGKLSDVFNL